MTNLQIESIDEGNNNNELDLHKDIESVKLDFLKHLFGVLNPGEEIEVLKSIRAANDDIELSKVC